MATYLKLIEELKRRRLKMGLTQAQLAVMIGVKASTITHFENAYRSPKMTTFIRYAMAVGLELTLREVYSGNQVQFRDPNGPHQGSKGASGV